MTAIVDTPEEAAALELPPLLVRRPLETFLDERGIGAGAIEATTIGEGHSNITYLIAREDGTEVVLRRPPRPPLPPSAHDVLREATLLSAVGPADVRTPKVLATCDDASVIGSPFYVMEKVDGHVMTTSVPDELDTPVQRRRIGDELIDALVEVHAVDWQACGLKGFGKPQGYLERQLRRFAGLWDHNKTREIPDVDEVTRWLAEHRPEQQAATIVHGDYRLGNTMYAHGAQARLVSIFDWELATIGDPLADLGYLTVTYPQPGDPPDGIYALAAVTQREGFPSREELIARYEERSARPMRDLRWYQTLALWKSCIFLEGSYKRLLAGTTDDPWYRTFGTMIPELAERAKRVALGG